MSVLILVVDDEPDVELLFRQRFRQDVRAGRFSMEFAQSAVAALQRITDVGGALILILSDINMPGMSGLELLPRRGPRARRPCHHDHRLWRCRDEAQGTRGGCEVSADEADRFCHVA